MATKWLTGKPHAHIAPQHTATWDISHAGQEKVSRKQRTSSDYNM